MPRIVPALSQRLVNGIGPAGEELLRGRPGRGRPVPPVCVTAALVDHRANGRLVLQRVRTRHGLRGRLHAQPGGERLDALDLALLEGRLVLVVALVAEVERAPSLER